MIIINGLVLSLTYFLVASGLTIVFSIMGIINFAHGSVIMLGGMVAYYSFTFLGLNFYLSLILAMAVTAAFSLLLNKLVFNYFKNIAKIYWIKYSFNIMKTIITLSYDI